MVLPRTKHYSSCNYLVCDGRERFHFCNNSKITTILHQLRLFGHNLAYLKFRWGWFPRWNISLTRTGSDFEWQITLRGLHSRDFQTRTVISCYHGFIFCRVMKAQHKGVILVSAIRTTCKLTKASRWLTTVASILFFLSTKFAVGR